MNCSNCSAPIEEDVSYCPCCGNKVHVPRLTFKAIMNEIIQSAFGWDSKFFRTLRTLLLTPEKVFKTYLGGARKTYANPFGLMAIGAFISIIVFGFFIDTYLENVSSANQSFQGSMEQLFGQPSIGPDTEDINNNPNNPIVKHFGSQEEFQESINRTTVKYMNVYMFLMLPMYSLISFLVFKKKGNYFGEHIAMNAYMQGLLSFIGVITFLISTCFKTSLFSIQFMMMVLLYTYAFQRFYKQSFSQVIVSLLRFVLFFLLVGIALFIILVIIGIGVGIIMATLSN